MLNTINESKVKCNNEVEDKVREVKKASSGLNHETIRKVLLAGVGAELVMLGNYGYNFYKSGVGIALKLPYCNYIIPYWFLALAIASPIIPKLVNKSFKFVTKNSEVDSSDLTSMWGKRYGNDK